MNFLTRIVDSSCIFHNWLLQVSLIPEPIETAPNFSLFRFARYEMKLKKLLALIGNKSPNTIVGIEGYSYQSSATEAESILKELGGCLRYLLCNMQHIILEIPPSTVKKIFSAQGGADKNDMYQAYIEKYKLSDLFSSMNVKRPPKNIPNPISDLVDALAVAMSTLFLCAL